MGFEMLFSTRLAAELAVHLLGKGTLLLAAAALAVTLLRRGSPGQRHAVWSGAFVLALLLPAAGAVLPLPTRQLDLLGAPAELVAFAPPPSGPLAGPDGTAGTPPADPAARAGEPRQPGAAPAPPLPFPVDGRGLALGFTILWAAGVVLLGVRLIGHQVRIAVVVARGRPARPGDPVLDLVRREAARMGLRRPVRLVWSSRLGVPATGGVLRPVLILPPGAARWPGPRIRAVVLHELAHVRRWDLLAHQVAELALVAYWINPLVWLARRAAADERERACDREVLGSGVPGHEYAGILVEMAKRGRADSPALDGSLAMSRPGGALRRRVMSALDGPGRPAAPRWAALAVGGIVALTAVPLVTVDVLAVPAGQGSLREAAESLVGGTLEERLRAVRGLALWCRGEATRLLAGTLADDPEPGVRTAAALALGRHTGEAALAALAATAADPGTPLRVRRAAVEALGSLGEGDRSMAAPVGSELRSLLDDADPAVRRLAVNGLGRAATPPTSAILEALGAVLLDDPEPVNRRAAASVLHRLACVSALPVLEEAWRTDPSAGVREHVGELLRAHEPAGRGPPATRPPSA